MGGADLRSLKRRELARQRAYLPRGAGVDWPISVERIVALGLNAHLPAFGGLPREWHASIEAALDRYGLKDPRAREGTELSGGELARVMLARATVSDPEVLIIDEPTAELDPRHAIEAGRLLRVLTDEGFTIVAAMHDLSLAMRIADGEIALRLGQVVAQGIRAEDFRDAVLNEL